MRRIVISGMIGNGLEWYDYALYGYFSGTISKLFFPSENPFLSLIATFGVFAAGFLMRPIGGVLFGFIGDKYGRRTSLTFSILLMAVPTACIGLLPTYAHIGLLAPVLLTVIRLLQGLSLGGEFSGSIAFIVEHAPDKHRGIAGSSSMFSMAMGMLCGSLVAALFSSLLTLEDFESWGWRIPFLFGLVVGMVGLYIRSYTHESPKYIQAKAEGHLSETPAREAFAKHTPELIIAIGIYLTVTVPFYLLTVFMGTFMAKILAHPVKDAMLINAINMVVIMAVTPFSAYLSDRIGRKVILLATAVGFLVLAYPIIQLLSQDGFTNALIAQMMFATLVGFFIGPVPAVLVELFPTSVRYSGMAISYNICAALFGGTAPMVATWLIAKTQENSVIAFYIMLCAAITCVTLVFYKDRYREPL